MTQPAPPVEADEDGLAESIPALLAAAETAVAAAVLAAYTAWLAEVATAVLGGFIRFGVSPNPDALWSTAPSWNAKVDALLPDLLRIAERGWVNAGAQLRVNVAFNPADPLLQDSLQRTRNLLVRTPDEVYRLILKALDAHAGDLNAQVAAVRNVLNVTGTENWPARAKTVAVTEVHRAYSMGGYGLASRFAGTKTWIAKDDSATRPGHRRADGQTVAIKDPFIVAREPLMFPGDPAGSASNVISCRCKTRYRRSNGR